MITPRPAGRLAPVQEVATPSSISALPSELDLQLYAGDDFAFTLTLTDSSNQPVDLTGATAEAQIRTKPGTPDPPAASFICSISTNVITLTLQGTATQDLVGSYSWDCQVTYSGGTVSTVVMGSVKFTEDVTI
jgi:hypothetical protein